jgi:hypothetical protein
MFGKYLRILLNENLKQWDHILDQYGFAYNDSPNRITWMSSFHIFNVMHPRGVYELRNLGKQELRSVDGEDFAVSMQELQEGVKQKLQDNNHKYKQQANTKRISMNFEVGYLVMVYLRKERFPIGTYNKLNLNKIAPCIILRKFSSNEYEI